jgi:hypothetical protein
MPRVHGDAWIEQQPLLAMRLDDNHNTAGSPRHGVELHIDTSFSQSGCGDIGGRVVPHLQQGLDGSACTRASHSGVCDNASRRLGRVIDMNLFIGCGQVIRNHRQVQAHIPYKQRDLTHSRTKSMVKR